VWVDADAIQPSRAADRAKRLVPFLAVLVCTFPLTRIGGNPETKFRLVAWAFGLFMGAAILVVVTPWRRLPAIFRLLVMAMFCVGVALLRLSDTALAADYALLLLLPIVWLAAYGRRTDVLASLVCIAITLGAPIVVVGPPDYPIDEWRRMFLATMTFALTGLVVNRIVTRMQRQQHLFSTVVDASHRLTLEDVGSICPPVKSATGADVVTYAEIDGPDRVLVSLGDGSDAVPTRMDRLAPPFRTAVAEARQTMAMGGATAPGPWCSLADLSAVIHHPVMAGEEVLGVISMGWIKSNRNLDIQVHRVVEMLAAEAAVAAGRQQLVRRFERLAHLDQLTGALNRRAWDRALAAELARPERDVATIALVDFDNFKTYNDEHGHLAGDDLLVHATANWKAELRDVDVLARWGGEEFVLLLPDTSLDDAGHVLDRLRAVMPDGQSFSAGIVEVVGTEAAPILRAADAALYRAKAQGRARNAYGEVVVENPAPSPSNPVSPLGSAASPASPAGLVAPA
jgi:diguanylate cyclase (GGDEF)-like protein